MKAVKVACGQSFSAVLMDDGTVWGCGLVGLRTSKTFSGQVMIKIELCSPLGRIKDIAANYDSLYVINEQNVLSEVHNSIERISVHIVNVETPLCGSAVFGLKDYGVVWASGRHDYASSNFAKVALPEELDKNVISLSPSGERNLALITKDHNLYTGGWNHQGQLGDGTQTDDRTPKCILTNAQQVELVSGPHDYGLAVTQDGRLYGWGSDSGNWIEKKGIFTERNAQNIVEDRSYRLLLTPQIILENISLVTSGFGHILAITKEGQLLSWGENSDGQLGDGSFSNRFDPKPVFSDAKYAKAGNGCSFVIDESGELWACGSNYYGQLGIGTLTSRCSSFVRVQFH
jgi:alpha-tubulin suppressor-like RCC1 family protein